MKLLILCGVTMIGFILGAAYGMPDPTTHGDFPMAWAMVGTFAGMICGELLLHAIGSRKPRKRSTTRVPRKADHNPTSFRARLARFTGRNETDLSENATQPFESSMPFWSAFDTLSRKPPRSGEFLRRILLRIRRILHT